MTQRRALKLLATLLVILGFSCGREANPFGSPDLQRFCAVAVSLERGAARSFAELGPRPSSDLIVQRLREFTEAHRDDYIALERSARVELRKALRAQRALRSQLFVATSAKSRRALFVKTIVNGTVIRRYEARVCQNPKV